MKRIPYLLLSLCLSLPAMAIEPAVAEAPESEAIYAEAIGFPRLALAFSLITSGKDFQVCDTLPTYSATLTAIIQDDLRGYGVGSEAIIDRSNAFTAEEKVQAALLPGLLAQPENGLSERVANILDSWNSEVAPVLNSTKDPDAVERLREDSANVRDSVNSGTAKVSSDDLAKACIGGAILLARKDVGPVIDRYRSLLKEKFGEYTAYRSPEGYLAARWGMTPQEVAAAEALPVSALKAGRLVRIDGSPARVNYIFTDGRLSEVVVNFAPGCKPVACLGRYRTVNSLLKEKYGEGEDYSFTDDEALSKSASMLFEQYGRSRAPEMLIQSGYRKEEHGWQTKEGVVLHQLYSNKVPLQSGSTQLVHSVRYLSKTFLPRADYLRRQKENDEKKKRLKNL